MSRPVAYTTQRTLIPSKDELAEGMERLLARSFIALRMHTQYSDLCGDIKALLVQIEESRRPAPPPCPDCGGPCSFLNERALCMGRCWDRRPQRGRKREGAR